MLSAEEAILQTNTMLGYRQAEAGRLDRIREYLRGTQRHPATPQNMPPEVTRLARMSRVNFVGIVVNSVVQAMYVEGYRQPSSSDEAAAWRVWQANRLDRRQASVHRACLTYGTAYVMVLPGEPAPVIRGYSPRRLTAVYGPDDDEWPEWALRADRGTDNSWIYRLYDSSAVYRLHTESPDGRAKLTFDGAQEHGLGVVPVIRFLNEPDLDEDNVGEVEQLMVLQDQVDLTTFELLVAQHYAAFRQRYVIGWTAPDEAAAVKASVAKLWTFDDPPDQVKVGEFEETDLKGYLESREASLRHAATLSQTPIHELTGTIANLSAEALVAAEVGQRRKIAERQLSFGESWEQALALAGRIAGFETSEQAQVRWRDTEARALSATVDALGKMSRLLGVPAQELWERIPGVSQQDIERWKAAFTASDAFSRLQEMLDKQAMAPSQTGQQA